MRIFERIQNKLWQTLILPKAKIKIDKKVFKVPRIQNNSFYKISYQSEVWLLNLLKSIHNLKPINTFVDVGVNIGQTLLKIKSVNINVHYYGFEPSPFCCSMTEQIISRNKFNNSRIISCGLSDKPDLLKLRINKNHDMFDSSASLVEGFRELDHQEFQYVPVLKLDDIIKDLHVPEIGLIKIDIEGAELEAISGMMVTLQEYQPIIIMEVLPTYNDSNEFRVLRQKKLADLLKQVDYKIFHIKNAGEESIFEQIIEFPSHKNVNESDYLMIPKHINIKELGL